MEIEQYKRPVIYLLDILFLIISIIISYFIRFELSVGLTISMMKDSAPSIFVLLITYNLLYIFFGINRKTWSKVVFDDALNILKLNVLSLAFIYILTPIFFFPRSIIISTFFITTYLQFFSRMGYGYYKLRFKGRKKNLGVPVFIYGAGSAGKLIVSETMSNPGYDYYVAGIIDDNPKLKGSLIFGKKVLGGLSSIEKNAKKYNVKKVIFAIPSLPDNQRNEILSKLVSMNFKTKVVTSSENLLENQNLNKSLRDVDVKDLLDRKEIQTSDNGVPESIDGKVVLVTGAGGSIGSELVRQIADYSPKKILMLDINETGLYEIQQEMLVNKHALNGGRGTYFKALITSIRDKQGLDEIFSKYKPEIVFHAAAHKHVPLMEEMPNEAIKNNIFGTHNLVEMCIKHNVVRMVNVSTDKAVNPTNVMGASKRFNEMMIQAYNNTSPTKFVAVRFGNVLGSNGSVVPLFKKQIEAGGPVTLTHRDITRYFMTIPEAVSLILQANVFAEGGEIFVLDMGEPVKILHLAEQLIRLSGFKPYKDIDIKFIGLRPGEKLYEELLMAEEGLEKTENNLIHVAKPLSFTVDWIQEALRAMASIVSEEHVDAKIVLQEYVETYNPENIN